MPNLEPFQDFLPIPDVVEPAANNAAGHRLTIKAKVKLVKLHKDLPPTEVWSYRMAEGVVIREGSGASYLGPTIVVNRRNIVKVRWANKIKAADYTPGKLPYEVVKVDPARVSGIPQNVPGKEGALSVAEDELRAHLQNLTASLVTHLHGGRTQADSDGWPDNIANTDQSADYIYHNDQAATMLWYHDHANHVTRLNVFAGLAGVWLIRDDEETSLDLPDCDFELPLVIQDRNLDVEAGSFTGKLLHKTEVNGGPAEFFGPYTLVNGKIWPKASVEPRLYRLRVLNGSNARTYRLMLLDAQGTSQHGFIWQIGCDQGLMQNKAAFPADGLVVSSGERVDLLVDFTRLATQSLYLWNTAEAPFSNSAITANPAAELAALKNDPFTGNPTDADRRPYPQIMRFDVEVAASGVSHSLPPDPLWRRSRPPVNLSANMPIRLMALVEKPPLDATGTAMLVFWEYMRVASEPAPTGADIVNFTYVHPATGLPVTEAFWKAAEEFYDRINWKVHLGDTEQWYIVNVSPDTHPIHVHLVDMDVTQQYQFDLAGYTTNATNPLPTGTTEIDGNTDTITSLSAAASVPILADQAGPKDTIRINPGEMVGVAMKFSPFCGKYMYHCHILEHEDDDMMRPFVVVPKSVPHHGH
ncbi:multicopper oxidase family protein [Methyloglobulus sp.]|uniref:multicopper oxidase family protein n=1 Tax=Methyloglobulus sp. TaxID=2518622 RepID=UPI0032B88267